MKKIGFIILIIFISCSSESENDSFDNEKDTEELTVTIEITGEGNSIIGHALSVNLYHFKDSDEGWVDSENIVKEGQSNSVLFPYNKTITINKHPEGGLINLRATFYECITVQKFDLIINNERVCRKGFTSRSSDCSGGLYNIYCNYEY